MPYNLYISLTFHYFIPFIVHNQVNCYSFLDGMISNVQGGDVVKKSSSKQGLNKKKPMNVY